MADDTYTVKELVQELREETKQQSSALSRIESHLATLNSKVASHELMHAVHTKSIAELSTFRTQAMVVWGLAVAVVTTVANKFI